MGGRAQSKHKKEKIKGRGENSWHRDHQAGGWYNNVTSTTILVLQEGNPLQSQSVLLIPTPWIYIFSEHATKVKQKWHVDQIIHYKITFPELVDELARVTNKSWLNVQTNFIVAHMKQEIMQTKSSWRTYTNERFKDIPK